VFLARAPFDQLVGWAVIVGTVAILATLVLTILYGHGPWRDRRRKPDLSLISIGDPNWTTMPDGSTWCSAQLALRNEGNGVAENWSVRIEAAVGAQIMMSNGGRGPAADWATDSLAKSIAPHDPQAFLLDTVTFEMPAGGTHEWLFQWQGQAMRMRRVHGFILVVPGESMTIQRQR
jgi:hypothetical protein